MLLALQAILARDKESKRRASLGALSHYVF